jgi:hypothetical protein
MSTGYQNSRHCMLLNVAFGMAGPNLYTVFSVRAGV